MIMMCACRFIVGNKCTPLVSDVVNGGGHECVRAGGVCTSQFCYKPKTVLKKLNLLKKLQ